MSFVAVCASVGKITLTSYEWILTIFSRTNAYVLGMNRLAFGEDPDYFVILDHFPGFFTVSR